MPWVQYRNRLTLAELDLCRIQMDVRMTQVQNSASGQIQLDYTRLQRKAADGMRVGMECRVVTDLENSVTQSSWSTEHFQSVYAEPTCVWGVILARMHPRRCGLEIDTFCYPCQVSSCAQ
jgi:hypothetical protein